MIQLDSVSKSYHLGDSEVPVLRDLDMQVTGGSKVAIVGPSGSGKSTLLLILVGLEDTSSGNIVIDGQTLNAMSADQKADMRRDRIGIIFQSFHLINSLSALDNVALPLEIKGVSGARAAAKQMLAKVGLESRTDHYPTQLSGGEQQRVAIARALVHNPAIIVADEPTGNLDDSTGESIVNLLFDLNSEMGTTLVLVTHDLTLADRCDRVLKMHDGHVIDDVLTAQH